MLLKFNSISLKIFRANNVESALPDILKSIKNIIRNNTIAFNVFEDNY